jgi:hypothetical protein
MRICVARLVLCALKKPNASYSANKHALVFRMGLDNRCHRCPVVPDVAFSVNLEQTLFVQGIIVWHTYYRKYIGMSFPHVSQHTYCVTPKSFHNSCQPLSISVAGEDLKVTQDECHTKHADKKYMVLVLSRA